MDASVLSRRDLFDFGEGSIEVAVALESYAVANDGDS